jgi:hypothetical protein
MSTSQILTILALIVLLVWYFRRSASMKEDVVQPVPEEPQNPIIKPTTPAPIITPQPLPSEPSKPKSFELIDIENPKLRVNSDVLKGTKKVVVWDSKRVSELRKRFQVIRILDQIEFQEGSNVIEVYRVVATESLSTFVFPRADSDDDIIELKTKISEDPSKAASKQKQKPEMNIFRQQVIGIPDDMIERIRELDVSYSKRQASSGPKAIDTHSPVS